MDIYEFLGGQNSDETVRAYRTDLEQFKVIAGGDLTRGGIILFRDTLIKQGLSPSTVARKMSSVRSFCEFLRGQGKLSIDPFAGVKAPKVSVAEPTQAFTDDEVRKTFKAVEKTNPIVIRERDRMVLGFLFYAGLRRSEIVALKLS